MLVRLTEVYSSEGGNYQYCFSDGLSCFDGNPGGSLPLAHNQKVRVGGCDWQLSSGIAL